MLSSVTRQSSAYIVTGDNGEKPSVGLGTQSERHDCGVGRFVVVFGRELMFIADRIYF